MTYVIFSEAELWWDTRPDVKCCRTGAQPPATLHQGVCSCVHSRDRLLAVFASLETANDRKGLECAWN